VSDLPGLFTWAARDGFVYALNGLTGTKIWATDAGSAFGVGVVASPAMSIDGFLLYIGSTAGFMYALNAANGSPIWGFQTGGPLVGAPVSERWKSVLWFK